MYYCRMIDHFDMLNTHEKVLSIDDPTYIIHNSSCFNNRSGIKIVLIN